MITVRDNPEKNRFELHDGVALAAFTDYKITGDEIAFTHTEVDPAFGGRGLGKQLVNAELDEARSRGLGVLPFCPLVLKVIKEKPEQFLDLVPAYARERFQLPAVNASEGQ